jgi:hypothetical protein
MFPTDPLSSFCFDFTNVPIYVPAPETTATLMQVHVHHRHGGYVPLVPWPYSEGIAKAPTFTCNPRVYPGNSTGAPFETTASYPGNCTDGQLTQQGWLDMAQIGIALRSAYMVGGSLRTHNFLPLRLEEGEVFVYASLNDRSIESAMAVLEGLFPPRSGDPRIQFHNGSEFGGDLLGAPWSCKNYTDIARRAYSEPDWVKFAQAFALPAADIAAHAWNVTEDVAYQMLNESMEIMGILKCAKVPYPALTDQQASQISGIRAEMLWDYATLPWSRGVFSAAWYTQVLAFLQAAAKSTANTPKLVQWSGHDNSLMNAVGAMNITQNSTTPAVNFPGYGSTLIFELWSMSTGPAVRALYNGRVISWPSAWCGQNTQQVCPMDKFTDMVNGALAAPGWQEACPMGPINHGGEERSR